MSISQICKFEVKEEIDHYVGQGLSRREAAKRLAEQLTELMGEEIKSDSIRRKDIRAKNIVETNVSTDVTTQDNEQKGVVQKMKIPHNEEDLPICKECEKKPIELDYRSKKPVKTGLCQVCRQRINKIKKLGYDLRQERFWRGIADKIDNLLDLMTERGQFPPPISREAYGRVMIAFKSLSFYIETFQKKEE